MPEVATGSIKAALRRIEPYLWEIPSSFDPAMRVPARVFATARMLEEIIQDRALLQLVNVATLPGIQGAAIAMPDVHEGYGFPIGGVAAMDYETGVVSPGGIGYDINCGVRLLLTDLHDAEVNKWYPQLAKELFRKVPSGMGKGGKLKLSIKELDAVLNGGAPAVVKMGFGTETDIQYLESFGCIDFADAGAVSARAKERGKNQLGTIGSGNHFVEVDRVELLYDHAAAKALGLFHGQIVVLIHTGSRGLGHQVATDYIKAMLHSMDRYGIRLRDRELACAPIQSEEGQRYLRAMAAAANFAWANRQVVTAEVREAFRVLFGSDVKIRICYDVAHNIAKVEEHDVEGERKKVVVHRKGATRAFPPGHPEVIEQYRSVGQPILIPGSMGTASYVLVGAPGSMKRSFGSTCHGAGRKMSRRKALKAVRAAELLKELESEGIYAQAGSMRGLAEEAPIAYKDVHSVVDVVDRAGIARKVAQLRPVAVIKG